MDPAGRPRPTMSLLAAWSPYFQARTRMKGRALQSADAVDRLEPQGDGELVRARVKNNGHTFTVTIRKDGRHAVAEADSPTFDEGRFCENIYATLVDMESNDAAPGAALSDLMRLQPRAPKARRTESRSNGPVKPAEPPWVGRLTLLRPGQGEQDAVDRWLTADRQAVYVVLGEASEREHALVIEVRQRQAIASGWSKPRPLRVSRDTVAGLPDEEDREVLAAVLGAAAVQDDSWGGAVQPRSSATFALPPANRVELLGRMIDTGRCLFARLDDSDGHLLSWDDREAQEHRGRVRHRPWTLWLVGSSEGDELVVDVELRRAGQRMPIREPDLVLGGPSGLLVHDGRVARFDDRDAYAWARQFRDPRYEDGGSNAMRVGREDAGRFLDRLLAMATLPELDLPADLAPRQPQGEAVPHLELHKSDVGSDARSFVQGDVWFDYDGTRVEPAQPGIFVPNSGANLAEGDRPSAPDTDDAAAGDGPAPLAAQPVRRDLRGERAALDRLHHLRVRPLPSEGGSAVAVPARAVPRVVRDLIDRGWVVRAEAQAIRVAGTPRLRVSSGLDWFDLKGGFRFERGDGESQEVPLPAILAAARQGKAMIELGDGSHGLLPQRWIEQQGLLARLGTLEDDALRFKAGQAALLDALLERADEAAAVEIDETFAQARERLRSFTGVEPIEPTKDFCGSLREYQKLGLGWFGFLRWFGVGGVLADDMGLGKTIQVLAMLLARKRGGDADGNGEPLEPRPSLIVAPKSVLWNWIDEAERFTPDIRVLPFTGPERHDALKRIGETDVLLTSSSLLRRDIAALKDTPFDYAVLDEAQAIKNAGSQGAKAARLLNARHRLALTGTPIENHLGDLWSIFEFLNPGMLGTAGRFNELVKSADRAAARRASAGAAAGDDEPTEPGVQPLRQLSAAMRPFILRRTKGQVLKELPPKTEQTILVELEGEQRKVYDQLRDYYRQNLLRQVDQRIAAKRAGGEPGGRGAAKLGNASFMVLEALLRLRQAACHPALISGDAGGAGAVNPSPNVGSAKLDQLDEQLDEIIDEGSKALVFSQFTSLLALVRRRLEARGIGYTYLDGQTRDRRTPVEQFQNDDGLSVFLISLKAGGFGLNLTAAQYVFLLDPWWNPAVEQQAIDRTHRIGQTDPVFAYRLIAQDTVEQRVLDLQRQKRDLAEAVVGGEEGSLLSNLTRDDLEKLFS